MKNQIVVLFTIAAASCDIRTNSDAATLDASANSVVCEAPVYEEGDVCEYGPRDSSITAYYSFSLSPIEYPIEFFGEAEIIKKGKVFLLYTQNGIEISLKVSRNLSDFVALGHQQVRVLVDQHPYLESDFLAIYGEDGNENFVVWHNVQPSFSDYNFEFTRDTCAPSDAGHLRNRTSSLVDSQKEISVRAGFCCSDAVYTICNGESGSMENPCPDCLDGYSTGFAIKK